MKVVCNVLHLANGRLLSLKWSYLWTWRSSPKPTFNKHLQLFQMIISPSNLACFWQSEHFFLWFFSRSLHRHQDCLLMLSHLNTLTIKNLDDLHVNFWCFLPRFLNLGNKIIILRFAFFMTFIWHLLTNRGERTRTYWMVESFKYNKDCTLFYFLIVWDGVHHKPH
jgi:hypothetical protein